MSKLHNLIEKFESDDEDAFKEDVQKVKSGAGDRVKKFLSYCVNNWLLILIAVFSYIAMMNAIEANEYAQWAYDSASDARYNAAIASDYAQDASDYAQEAASYARQARDEASSAATNAMLSW